MTIIKSPNITWLDIKDPSAKELQYLAETYNIHPLIIKGIEGPTIRSHAEDYNGYVYVVLHFPVFNPVKQISEPMEIDLIITPDTLISVRYQEIEPLEEFLKKCKAPSGDLKNEALSRGSIYLFYYLIKELYDFSLRQLDHIEEKIHQTEEAIFSGKEKEMLFALSLSRSDVLNFLRTLRPQSTILESLLARTDSFETKARPYLIDLVGVHRRVLNQAESCRETIEGLQATNESLLNSHTNEIMKLLTILATITLPLSLLANIFGMSKDNMPIIGNTNGFWVILGIMTSSVILLIVWFKSKKWL